MYMPGRLRTGSRPSRTWISSAVYLEALAISVHFLATLGVRQGLDGHRLRHDPQRRLLHDLVALAAASRRLLRGGLLRQVLATLLGLEVQHVALAAGDEADHRIVFGDLDHRDAAARTFELCDLVGLAVEHMPIARCGDDDIAVVARHDAEHFIAILRLRVAAARLRRHLGVLRGRDPQAEALARHREQRLGRQRARIERHRRDDAFAVAELEVLLRRIAVAGGRRDVVDLDDVATAAVREEDHLFLRRAGQHERDLIALARTRLVRILQFADALDPAVARDHDVCVLVDDERILVELLLVTEAAAGLRLARRAEQLADFLELSTHDIEQLVVVVEDLLDALRLFRLLLELLADHVDLELGELVELELEERIRLDVVELEALHDLAGGVFLAVAGADDLDRLVERIEDRDEAFQDVDALLELGEQVLEPALGDVDAEVEEVLEHLLDAALLRRRRRPRGHRAVGHQLGRHEARQVDVEARLQSRVLVEVRHHDRGFGVLLDLEHDADVRRGLVAHVEQVRQLARDDHVRDLLDEIRLAHRVRDRRDHHVGAATLLLLQLVLAAHADRAGAVLVDLAQLDLAVEHLAAGREVRTVDVLHQRDVLDLAILRQRAQHPLLRHAHHRVVDRGVAVRVIATDHGTDDLCALAVLRVGPQVLVVEHRVENAALHRLEAVAHIGQRTRRDDAECVVEIPPPRLVLERRVLLAGHSVAAAAGAD